MSTVKLNSGNFEKVIDDNDIVILDFWAQWCGPCRAFAPTFEQASEKHEGVVFGKVNTEEEKELAAMFRVRSIPMLMVFREQIPIFAQPGALPPQAFESLIEQVKALDMKEVRADYERAVAEQKAKDA